MAKRVKRVSRVKRKRMRSTKKVEGQQAGTVTPGASVPIDLDGAGDGNALAQQRLRRMRRKGGAGGAGGDADIRFGSESGLETEAATEDGITRKGGGSMGGGSDGFGGQQRGREAFEKILQGHIESDAEKFEQLRLQGQTDSFDPDLTPVDVERLGNLKAASHMVRLYDHWMLDGLDRGLAIQKAVEWLSGFSKTTNIRKVLGEMESKPIRDVYPLEVMVEFLKACPEKIPGFQQGPIIGQSSVLSEEKRIFAGHPCQIPVPPNMRLKAFALLGGGRPGYEFFPSPNNEKYTLQIDTPGTWEFALLGVQTEKLGKMEREVGGGVIDIFSVNVHDMGRKSDAVE